MTNRKKVIAELLQNMHAMRHKLMVAYMTNKKVAITPSQGFVLRFVAEHNTANVKAIAQALHISSSAATQLVDGLVAKGYLVRKSNSTDRRVISLILSEKAKKLFKSFQKQGLVKMTELFRVLTDKELEQYAALNKKVVNSII